jgi:hypothetical protein
MARRAVERERKSSSIPMSMKHGPGLKAESLVFIDDGTEGFFRNLRVTAAPD